MSSQSDSKGKIIQLKLPSETEYLLKPEDTRKFNLWFNWINNSAVNASANNNLEYFERALTKLEHSIARTDKKEVISLFTGTEAALKTEERRNIVFENLKKYKPEYKYLGELYNDLQTFDTMCKLGKFDAAMSCAEEICAIITQVEPDDTIPDQQEKVREMMSKLVDESMLKNIHDKLADTKAKGSEHLKELDLFTDLTKNLLKKIEVLRIEIRGDRKNLIPVQDLKLLEIPISHYKKACQWTAPNLLRDIELPQFNYTSYTESASKLKRPNSTKMTAVKQFNMSLHLSNGKTMKETDGYTSYRNNSGILDM